MILVDAEDEPVLASQGWGVSKKGHVNDGRGGLLHRILLGTPKGQLVDHKNRGAPDCRRANLRPANYRTNGYNAGPRRGGTSKYKGVSRHRGRCWTARIRVPDGRRLTLGFFADEVDAALAYDAAAREHHKEFALTNF